MTVRREISSLVKFGRESVSFTLHENCRHQFTIALENKIDAQVALYGVRRAMFRGVFRKKNVPVYAFTVKKTTGTIGLEWTTRAIRGYIL